MTEPSLPVSTQPPHETIESLFSELIPEIPMTVRYAYISLGVRPDSSQVDDASQQIILLLLENDFRRLRSYSGRALPKTWLGVVARNFVRRELRRPGRAISVEDPTVERISLSPTQDQELWIEERRYMLNIALRQLTNRERRLFQLFCDDSKTTAKIAAILGLRPNSVSHSKSDLIKKIQRNCDRHTTKRKDERKILSQAPQN